MDLVELCIVLLITCNGEIQFLFLFFGGGGSLLVDCVLEIWLCTGLSEMAFYSIMKMIIDSTLMPLLSCGPYKDVVISWTDGTDGCN